MFSGTSGVAIEMVPSVAHALSPLSRCSHIPRPNPIVFALQVEQIYETPSLNGVMDDLLFLQNIPSIVVGHLLDPQPGMCTFLTRPDGLVCWNVVECCKLIGILHDVGHRRPGDLILDMCAAPGGKTTHIAALANDRARIFALDKNVGKGALHSHFSTSREETRVSVNTHMSAADHPISRVSLALAPPNLSRGSTEAVPETGHHLRDGAHLGCDQSASARRLRTRPSTS